MPFDFATAQPVDQSAGFDFSSAQPVDADNTEKVFVQDSNTVAEVPKGVMTNMDMIGQSYDKGALGLELNAMYQRQLFGDDTPNVRRTIKAIKARLGEKETYADSVPIEFLRVAVEQTPQMKKLFGNIAYRGMQGGMLGTAVGSAAGGVGAVPGFFGGIGVGATFGAAETSFTLNAGEAYGQFSEMLDKEGVEIKNKNIARLGAVMVGLTNAGLDTVSLGALAKVFGADKVLMKTLQATGAKSLVLPATKEGVGLFIVSLSKDYAKYVAIETATEGAQEVIKDLGGDTVKYLSDQEFDSITADEMLENATAAMGDAFKASTVFGLVGGGTRVGARGVKSAISRKRDKKVVDAVEAAFAKSDLPEAVKQDIAEITASDFTMQEINSTLHEHQVDEIIIDDINRQVTDRVMASGVISNPYLAAQIILESPRYSEAQKQAVRALPQEFTMEQLEQAAAERANKAIQPIIEQMIVAQRKQVDNIQAETDDISMNLLREVTALQEGKSATDPEVKDMLEDTRALLQERRKTPKPLSLVGFIKKIGGVKEYSGELATIGMKNRRGARNDKTGLELDKAREAAAEAGYIDNDSTVADFLVALDNDFKRPDSVISENDIGSQTSLDEIDSVLSRLDKELGDMGITYNRKAVADLRKRVAANKKLDRQVAKEVKQKESKLRRLEADKLKAAQSPPAILADKLKTFISGMRKGGVLQKRETADVQNKLIDIIEQSGLEANDRAKFIRTIKNTQTIEQLEAGMPDIINRLQRLSEAKQRRDILSKLRSVLSKTKAAKQAGKPVGKLGAETQDILNPVREAIKMKPEAAANKLEGNMLLEKMPTPEQALVNKALAIASGDETITVKEMTEFLDEITNIITDGKTNRKNSVFARMVRIGSLKIEARDVITKGENLELIDETTFKRRLGKLWNNTRAVADGWLFGWYDIPDILFGKGDLRDKLRIGEQVQQEKGIVRRMTERLEEAGMQAFGFTKRKQLLNQISEDSKIIDLGVMPDASGKPRRLQMSKTQMRKLWMEWQDSSLHETLFSERGNGYTEEMVRDIMQYLTPEDRAFAQAQLDVYQEFYDDVNDVYSRVYGVNLPKNNSYSPIRREVDVDMEAGEFLTDINYRRSVSPGALKSRVTNLRRLKLQSDVETYQRHVMEMAHFISFAEKIQEISGVFGNASIRKAIEKKHGAGMVSIIDDYIRLMTLGGPERADVIGRVINTLNRNFAVSVLGGKAALLPKQLTSFVASAADMPIGAWTQGIADFAANYKKAINILSQSELMKSRGASPEKDIAAVGKAVDWEIFKKKQRFDEILLLPTKLGDRGAIYAGGWPVYRHAINQGKTHEQAMAAFESWVAVTQQSADVDQLSKIQASSPFVRAFTMFLSAPMAYLRAEVRAIRHYSRGEITRAQLAKKIAIYHFVIPSLFQFVANGFDWDDEDQIVAMVTGPLNGFVVFGDAIARAVGGAMGKHYFSGEPNFATFMADITKGIADSVKGAMEGDIDEILEGLADIMKGAGTAAGLPVDQAKNVFQGVEDIQDGNIERGTKRIAGWPKGAVEGDKKKKSSVSTP